MQIWLTNNYKTTIWVALMWVDVSRCGGDIWATAGWWQVNPGETVATNVWTSNRYWCYYAEAEDGAYWAGPYGPLVGTYAAFESCVGVAPGGYANIEVGMRELDAGWWYWSYLWYDLIFT